MTRCWPCVVGGASLRVMDSDAANAMGSRRNGAQRWSATVITLHWVMALAILVTMSLGWIAEDMPRSLAQYRMFGWHKSFGLLVLALAVLRVVFRLRAATPAGDDASGLWQRRAARVSHGLLYLCMFAMPISGWLINSAADVPLKWFWLVPVPAIAAASPQLAEIAETLHAGILWTLLMLIAIHATAALRHHFVLRDSVLWQILPFRGLRR